MEEIGNGCRKETSVAQNQKLIDQHTVETVKMKEMKIKAQAAKSAVLKKVEKNSKYQQEYEERIRENEALHKQDISQKAVAYQNQKQFESNLKTKLIQKNPYSMKVTMQTRKDAQKTLKGTEKEEEEIMESPELENDKIDDIDKKMMEEQADAKVEQKEEKDGEGNSPEVDPEDAEPEAAE